jgi:hypothetical protein
MKAEHRKELQTNVLADRLGRMYETVKSGSSSNSGLIWAVIAVVAVGSVIAWKYYDSKTSKTRSALWTKLDGAVSNADIKDLDQIASDNRGTLPARVARFQVARLLLQQGMDNLGSESRRADALEKIEQARAAYLELIPLSSDAPVLAQEAMMGAAKAEETLMGVPKADNPSEYRGTLERAIELYQQLAKAYPESFQGKAAEKRVKELQEKGTQIQNFYIELNKQFNKPKS